MAKMASITLEAIARRNGLTLKTPVEPFVVEYERADGSKPVGGWCYGEMATTWTIPLVMMINFEYWGMSDWSYLPVWFRVDTSRMPLRFFTLYGLTTHWLGSTGAACFAWDKSENEFYEATRIVRSNHHHDMITARFGKKNLSQLRPFRWENGDRLLMVLPIYDRIQRGVVAPMISESVMRRAVRDQ